MKIRLNVIKILKSLIIALFLIYPLTNIHASYAPIEGRISYLIGMRAATNFQEDLFNNNNNNRAKLGRSQSFDVVLQALGDLNEKSSLIAEVTFGKHKFYKESPTYLDKFLLESMSFDLGYRRLIGGRFWWSLQIGFMYPWRVNQQVHSLPQGHARSDFTAIYSTVLGIQYESTIKGRAVSYDLRIRKYMTSHLDDQASLGLGIGWRFQ